MQWFASSRSAVEPMNMRASTEGMLRCYVVSLWLNRNAQSAITDVAKKAVFSTDQSL
ncbi:hypothetical protein N234_25965 [Ralstonia pickettii DTP0602]|nr:hypothetical protein N234_25965 [Ralstonia pickettii DTP0602]